MAEIINWKHSTIIVPAAIVEAARELGGALTPAGAGMFTTPLSASGTNPPTHYISSGLLDENFLAVLQAPEILFQYASQGAEAQGITLTATLQDCEALIAESDVSSEDAFTAMARLGLQMVQEEMEVES